VPRLGSTSIRQSATTAFAVVVTHFTFFACAGTEFRGRSNPESKGGAPVESTDGKGGSSENGGANNDTGGATTNEGGSQAGGKVSTSLGGSPNVAPQTCEPLHQDPDRFHVEICVPQVTFTMGNDVSVATTGNHVSHAPAHRVTLSTYAIDAYEVTVGRYRACVTEGACTRPILNTTTGCTYYEPAGSTENLPISCVTILQATSFCQWDEGRRLPTEAEWEYAAAGANQSVFPWGSHFDCANAAIDSRGSCADRYSTPFPVGQFETGKSQIGAYDMTGNVAEWVKDVSGDYPSSDVTDPVGPAAGPLRIVRGGSFLSPYTDGQTFERIALGGSTTSASGFRCARSFGQ
jgi:formylglycine-generating enzyme required for sulfatase activity